MVVSGRSGRSSGQAGLARRRRWLCGGLLCMISSSRWRLLWCHGVDWMACIGCSGDCLCCLLRVRSWQPDLEDMFPTQEWWVHEGNFGTPLRLCRMRITETRVHSLTVRHLNVCGRSSILLLPSTCEGLANHQQGTGCPRWSTRYHMWSDIKINVDADVRRMGTMVLLQRWRGTKEEHTLAR